MPQVVVKHAVERKMAANPNIGPDLTKLDFPKGVDTKKNTTIYATTASCP
jgi:hypothetical protein